ncbi:hypothetical protein [Stenotrophomonas sp. UBA7606]|uniref:hypothetical protein n=1 Tax=Stenotrophomonas sp. UBA7606 TaxID=1947559 RepID=UPI0025F70C1F|nr:hypothetical protein [Stenotrophomonas sp. UBA7606]
MNRLPNTPEGFDRSLRQLQQQADSQLSAATLARLRQGRQQVGSRTSGAPSRRAGWLLATACSAVLAVALGLQFSNSSPPTPPAPAPTIADQSEDDTTLLFDESPELYLWLGSDTLAME